MTFQKMKSLESRKLASIQIKSKKIPMVFVSLNHKGKSPKIWWGKLHMTIKVVYLLDGNPIQEY